MSKKRGQKQKQEPVTVALAALGCAKNLVDSERMLAQIGQAGFILSGDTDNADVVVINTCGFIEPAKAEALEVIGRALEQKKKGMVKSVIAAGCLAQRMGKKLAEEVAGIDAVVAISQRDNIAKIIKQTLVGTDECGIYPASAEHSVSDDSGRILLTGPGWGYLRISEGCNRKCSFCTIPSIRGPFRSKPLDNILREANELADSGVGELILIAQDSSGYGKDLGIKNGLVRLIGQLEKIDGIKWIRLMYLYPSGIDDKLIETIAASKKVVNYIDMPVQHINDRILRDMRRADTEQKTRALIENLRDKLDGAVLRTTIIVGFPGETDAEFEQLLDFVRWAGFDALGCFPYYPEEGTESAKLTGQIPEEIKQARLEKLMLTQQEIAFDTGSMRIGREFDCIVETIGDGGNMQGRFYGQAPDIDGICVIKGCTAGAGEFVRTRVVGAKNYDLIVEQIPD
jgi:ribosomal protein S12 methylthiotransferase